MELNEIKRMIVQTEGRISELERDLEKIDEEIRQAQSEESRASHQASMGLSMMNAHSSMGMAGTHKYMSASTKASYGRVRISELERKKDFKSSQLFDEKRRLQNLKEEQEYMSRPDAVLIDSKNGLFIEGDKSKTNLLSELYATLNQYVQEYNAMIAEDDVKKVLELESQITGATGFDALPKFSKPDEALLKTFSKENPFNFVVVGGRFVVDADFTASEIKDEEAMIKYYSRQIEGKKAQAEDFQPTGLGRVFPKIHQKQKERFYSDTAWEIEADERRIEHGHGEIESWKKIHDKFVVPSVPFFEIVKKLAKLKVSKAVRKFDAEGETYRGNIQNHTILKNGLDYGNFVTRLIFSNRDILNKLGVKLDRDQVLAIIYSSEFHAELAKELKNAGYALTMSESSKGKAPSTPAELGL